MIWESLKDAVSRLEQGTPPPPTAGLFGASPRPDDCQLVLIPVPWDTTVSYGVGTAKGPAAIISASHQLDLEDGCFANPYRAGITMLPEDAKVKALNQHSREKAARVLASHAPLGKDDPDLASVNEASRLVNERVLALAQENLRDSRLVGVVGGDHSSPFGLVKALSEQHPSGFGVLHFDAHHDLREAYEGFEHSHASIMHNLLQQVPAVTRLVQVGIRDYSREERCYAQAAGERIRVFYNRDLFRRKAAGESWKQITDEILASLPESVYISFDVDGLDPALCPSTGTPVPGGLSFDEAVYIIEQLALSGRKIIGFDLCEVTPRDGDEWDANVGARLLYKLCGATIYTHGGCGLA